MIPHSRPSVGRKEEQAVVRVLRSSQLGGGEEVRRFEEGLAGFLRVGHATATQTGTAALHLALLALGMGPRSRVLLPSYVCAAVLHAVRYTGARPVLVDADPATGLPDPDDAFRKRRRASAVVVPHMFGLPAPIEGFRRLRIPVVEDCAMALGAERRGRPCGSVGDVSVFSFYATKMIATGHGGAVATPRADLARRIRDLVEYDRRDDARLRYNYRMSAMAAALGRVQLARVKEFIKARRRNADFYSVRWRGLPLALPPREGHVYHRYVIRAGQGLTRFLADRGIEAKRPVWRPLHQLWSERRDDFPGAEELHRTAVSVPVHPSLTPAERSRVAAAVSAYALRLA